MKKNILSIIVLFSIVGVSKVKAQTLYKCDTNKAYWTFRTDDNTFMYLKLTGNVAGIEHSRAVSVGNIPLQYEVAIKGDYLDKADSSDFGILRQFAKIEGDQFSRRYKSHLNVQMDTATLPGERKVLFWYFDMPQTVSRGIRAQLFIDIVVGNRILALSSKQFDNQNLGTMKHFLLNVIGTLTKADKDELTTLCGK